MPPQPPSPQCYVPPRRSSVRPPPQQQYSVPRVVPAEKTTVEKEKVEQRMEQRMEILRDEIGHYTDEGLARFERIIMEGSGRATAPVIVAPIGTELAQASNARSRCSGISFPMNVFAWGGKHRGQDGP